ncbi:MAG: glycerate kinase [Candidatus Dormibacterales bacterium]
MKLVVAPNPFKGSLSAPAAASAIGRGLRACLPGAEIVEIPLADGGEGTLEALVAALGGERVELEVEGPAGAPVRAAFGLAEEGRTAVVELASSSGLTLVPEAARDPRTASTFGFGQVLEAALKAGATRIVAGVGGSATNDGGAGMAQALGFRLLDGAGRELPRGGAALARLARVDASRLDPGWGNVRFQVATDVDSPLVGPEGASLVYGPQKGATPETARELDAALARLAEIVRRDLGSDLALASGACAAGGTAFGLASFLGAEMVPGAALVAEAAGLDAALQGADLLFTGEGTVDGQTLRGKGPMEAARRARAAGVPAVIMAGRLGPG